MNEIHSINTEPEEGSKTLVAVEVTRDDIQNGEPGNTTACPIALALRRLLSEDWTPRVEPSAVFFYRRPNPSHSFTLADHSPLDLPAQGFVNEYDSYGEIDTDTDGDDLACIPEPPKPFTFFLAVPKEALR